MVFWTAKMASIWKPGRKRKMYDNQKALASTVLKCRSGDTSIANDSGTASSENSRFVRFHGTSLDYQSPIVRPWLKAPEQPWWCLWLLSSLGGSCFYTSLQKWSPLQDHWKIRKKEGRNSGERLSKGRVPIKAFLEKRKEGKHCSK